MRFQAAAAAFIGTLSTAVAGCAPPPAAGAAPEPVVPTAEPSASASAPAPEPAEAQVVTPAPQPPEATPTVIQIVVEEHAGYDSATRAQKLKDAVAVAEKVLNDPDYGRTMASYPDHHTLAGFTQATMWGGGSVSANAAPMADLLRGNRPDGQIHVWLAVSHPLLGGGVGKTTQNAKHDGVTLTNGRVLDKLTVAQLADHIVHEHMHRIGYQHADPRSIERCDSVPYAFGRTVCAFATHKYGLPGTCDAPDDWPPEQLVPRTPPHGPPC